MRYGCITGVHRSKEYPVAASQKFLRANGGAFVIMNGSGHLELALTATATIFGYVVIPQNYVSAGTDSAVFQSSATAGADRLPVIRAVDAKFLVKADDTPTQSQVGNLCDLIGVNDGTAQLADIGTSTTDVLRIVDIGTNVGGAATSVVVEFNVAKLQSDT
jgi:hypothetical protein